MARLRFFTLTALLLVGSLVPAALAQPLILPGARLPSSTETPPAGLPLDPGNSGQGAAPTAPAPPAPRPAKIPREDTILNRDLRLNGASGSLRVERAGKSDLRARVALSGTRLSRPGEACSVKPEAPVAVVARGRTDGLARYEIQVPACPITADLLDGALWVRSGEECAVEAADCRVDPRGLWGPEPTVLAAQARVIEADRGQADKTVRENYRTLAGRARPQDVRAIVSEQAAFSSDRETLCRSYAREAAHGFCNARFTEARAAQLAARLGIAGGAPAPRKSAAPRTPVMSIPE